MLTLTDHWVDQARHLLTDNCDERPAGAVISLIVLHNISLPPGSFGGPWIDRFFTNCLPPDAHPFFHEICQMRVSAHFFIGRQGELVQYVPCDRRAWHAGRSCWQGRENCNDFSIGIELEGTDEQAYTDTQYRVLTDLIHALWQRYATLSPESIAGHADIAPERKTDPGRSFDWQRLRQLLQQARAPGQGADRPDN